MLSVDLWLVFKRLSKSLCVCVSAYLSDTTSDRYFMALYRKLLDPALQSSNKIALFLNLLFRSLKSDQVEKRVQVILV